MISIDYNFVLSSSVGNRVLQFGNAPDNLSIVNVFRSTHSIVASVNTSNQMISNSLNSSYTYPVFSNSTLTISCDNQTAGNWRFRDSPAGNVITKNWIAIRLMEKSSNLIAG
ncbi:MAG: hypothetical protein IT232_08545 [Flavobacteriales bacterium]|nr:hypothetical protein [Flavobacteriales bacterium]